MASYITTNRARTVLVALIALAATCKVHATIPISGVYTHEGTEIYLLSDMCDRTWDDVLATAWAAYSGSTTAGDFEDALTDFWSERCLLPKDPYASTPTGLGLSSSTYPGLTGIMLPFGNDDHTADPLPVPGTDDPHICGFGSYGSPLQQEDFDIWWDHVKHANPSQELDEIDYMSVGAGWLGLFPPGDPPCFNPSGTPAWDPDCFGLFDAIFDDFIDEFGYRPTYDLMQLILPASPCPGNPFNGDCEGIANSSDPCKAFKASDAVTTPCGDLNGDSSFDWKDLAYGGFFSEMCSPSCEGNSPVLAMKVFPDCEMGCEELDDSLIALFGGVSPEILGAAREGTGCTECSDGPTGFPSHLQIPHSPTSFPAIDCSQEGPLLPEDLANYIAISMTCVPVAGAGIGGEDGAAQPSQDDLIAIGEYWGGEYLKESPFSCSPDGRCIVAGAGTSAAFKSTFGHGMSPSQFKGMFDTLDGISGGCDFSCNPFTSTGVGGGSFQWNTSLPVPTDNPGDVKAPAFPPTPDFPTTGDPSFDPCDHDMNGAIDADDMRLYFGIGEHCAGWDPPGANGDAQKIQAMGLWLSKCPGNVPCGDLPGIAAEFVDDGILSEMPSVGTITELQNQNQCASAEAAPPNTPPNDPPPNDPPADDPGKKPEPCPDEGTETANPVDLAYGHKKEQVTDLRVRVTGPDFTLTRSYTSQPEYYSPSDTDLLAGGLVGHNWWLDCFTFLHEDTAANPDLIHMYSPDIGTVTYVDDGTGNYFYPTGKSTQYIKIEGSGASRVAKLIHPGKHEYTYYLQSTSDDPDLLGLPKSWRDVYGNSRSFEYGIAGPTTGSVDYRRLKSIWLNGTDDTDSEAEVRFIWAAGSITVDTSTVPLGMVNNIQVWRYPDSADPVKTQEVVYTYNLDDGEHHAATGTVGDLIQVEHRVRIDESPTGQGQWHKTYCQYRYHDPDQNETTVDDDDDGFTETGNAHQLKCVILPAQIEYAHQQYYRNSTYLRPVSIMAEWLLTLSDDAIAYTDADGQSFKVIDLAAKVVETYEDFISVNPDPDEHGRVLTQYLKSSCGCSGGGTYGTKYEYEYITGFTPPSSDYDQTTKITESILNGSAYEHYRNRYYDLKSYNNVDTGDDYFMVVNSVVEGETNEMTPQAKYWVTHYEHDAATRLVTKQFTPSAMSDYTPSNGTAAPSYTAKSTGGLVYQYKYWSDSSDDAGDDKRLTEVLIREENGSNFHVVSKITYGDETQTDERYHLPKKIERFRVNTTDGTVSHADEVETVELKYDFHELESENNDIKWIEIKVESGTAAELDIADSYYFHEFFNTDGQNDWSRDATDTLTFRVFDTGSGSNHTGVLTSVEANADDGTSFPSTTGTTGGLDFTGRNNDGKSLTTTVDVDLLGRTIAVTSPNDVIARLVRQLRVNPERPGMAYYAEVALPHVVDDTTVVETVGPAVITWYDSDRTVIAERDYDLDNDATEFGSIFAGSLDYNYSLKNELARTHIDHDLTGLVKSVRSWHSLAGDGESNGVYTHSYAFDSLGRVQDETDSNGSITRTVYDVLDRVRTISAGTSTSNLVDVIEFFYDGDESDSPSKVGNSNITKITQHTGEVDGSQDPIDRETILTYDWRDRLIALENSAKPHMLFEYDPLDRLKRSAIMSDLPTGLDIDNPTEDNDRGTLTEYFYSQRGLPFKKSVYLDPQDATPADNLDFFTWFDGLGRMVGAWGPNGPGVKNTFDGLGRLEARYVVDRESDASHSDVTSSHASVLTSDIVFEETHYSYIEDTANPNTDDYIGRIDLVTRKRRNPHLADTDTGALSGTDDAIITYQGAYYDEAGRLIRSVNFGTDSSNDLFEYQATAPTITQKNPAATEYNDRIYAERSYNQFGLIDTVTDPEGITTRLFYDDLYRRIGVAESYVNASLAWDDTDDRWVASNLDYSTSWDESDTDRVTSVVYDGVGQIIKRIAHIPETGGAESAQVTQYFYNAISGTGATDSRIDSFNLLTKIIFPDSDGTGGDFVTIAYNRLGEPRYTKDQNATEHTYTRDLLGRVTRDDATVDSLGDIDDHIIALEMDYDEFGRPSAARSIWLDVSTEKTQNEVEFTYTDFWQIDQIKQEWRGDVDVNSPVVDYTYANSVSGGAYAAGNYSRFSQLDFPYGRDVRFTYGSGGSSSDHISRLTNVRGSAGSTLHEFIGLGRVSLVDFAAPDVQLNRSIAPNGETTDGEHHAFDRYGRVINHLWIDGNFGPQSPADPDVAAVPPIVQLRYGYDDIGNVLHRLDDRPDTQWASLDLAYRYDDLHRLIEERRGIGDSQDLIPTANLADDSHRWTLDVLGNQTNYVIDKDGDDVWTDNGEQQTATFTDANEIDTVTVVDSPNVTLPFTYDDAGNLMEKTLTNDGTDTTSFVQTFDAWNRLVKVQLHDTSQTSPDDYKDRGIYEYNALHQRVVRDADTHGSTTMLPSDGTMDQRRYMYYDAGWRLIEERIDDAGSFTDAPETVGTGNIERVMHYTWGIRGKDDLLYRAQSDDTTNDSPTVSYEDTWFHLTDRSFTPAAIINDTADVLERYRVDAYGRMYVHPGADVDGDHVHATSDGSRVLTVAALSDPNIGGADYDVHADLDRDGQVGNSDYSLTSGSTSAVPGVFISHPDIDNIVGYNGYLYNQETGYYTVRYRDYDPTNGRFLQRDPLGYADGSNLYEYVGSNPTGFHDPYGLNRWDYKPVRREDGSIGYDIYLVDEISTLEAFWQNQYEEEWHKIGELDATGEWVIMEQDGRAVPMAVIQDKGDDWWSKDAEDMQDYAVYQDAEKQIAESDTFRGLFIGYIDRIEEAGGGDLSAEETADILYGLDAAGDLVEEVVFFYATAPLDLASGARSSLGLIDDFVISPRTARVLCFVEGTLVHTSSGPVAIEDLELGQRVLTRDDERSDGQDSLVSDPSQWRVVTIILPDENGRVIKAQLLRPLAWLEADNVQVGDHILLQISNMNISGAGRVLSFEPCPAIEIGPGRLVVSTFTSIAEGVIDLYLAGRDEPISVTAEHPVYSIDRDAFVPVKRLEPGELLLSLDGAVELRAVVRRHETVRVYNVEVAEEHVYYVSESGILAHNACSRTLGRALEGSEQASQGIRNAGYHAHHIIESGSARMARHRALLARYGVGIDSAENGVWLAADVHRHIHTNRYFNYVDRAFEGVTSRDELLDALDDVRYQLEHSPSQFYNDNYRQVLEHCERAN